MTRSTPLLSSDDEATTSTAVPLQKKASSRRAKSPSRRAKSPGRRGKSPGRRAKSPGRRAKSPGRQQTRVKKARVVKRKGEQATGEEAPVVATEVSVVTKTLENNAASNLFESKHYSLRSTRTYKSSNVALSSDEEDIQRPRSATTRMSLSQSSLRRRLAEASTPPSKPSLGASPSSVSPTFKRSVRTRLAFESLRAPQQPESQDLSESDYPSAAEEKIIPPSLPTQPSTTSGGWVKPPSAWREGEREWRGEGERQEVPSWMQIGFAELVFAVVVTIIVCCSLFGYQLGYF